jgi:hypothetical protein
MITTYFSEQRNDEIIADQRTVCGNQKCFRLNSFAGGFPSPATFLKTF